MQVIEKGHVYKTANRRVDENEMFGDHFNQLVFINKEPGRQHGGTTTQEVIRVLIDRTRHCNNCMPHPNNERVIYHLRMALVLHEARALERKVEKWEYMPEYVRTGEDGHFGLGYENAGDLDTMSFIHPKPDWERECNHIENSKPEREIVLTADPDYDPDAEIDLGGYRTETLEEAIRRQNNAVRTAEIREIPVVDTKNRKRGVFGGVLALLSVLTLVACTTPTYTMRNPETKQVVIVGGSATGSMTGGMIGYHIQRTNDLDKVEKLQEEGFVVEHVDNAD